MQPGTVKHIAPDREKRLGQSGGFDITEALRYRQALRNRCDAQLRIPTTGNQRANAVTDLEACSGHGLRVATDDGACHFQTGNVRRARRHRVVARTLQHIWAIHTAGGYTNQQLSRTSDWRRTLTQTQNVRRAVRGDFDCFHGHFRR